LGTGRVCNVVWGAKVKEEEVRRSRVLISGEEVVGKRSVSNKMTLGGYQPNPTNSLSTPRKVHPGRKKRRLYGSCAAPKHQRHFPAKYETPALFPPLMLYPRAADEMDNNNNNKANPRGTNFRPIFFLHTISIMSCCESLLLQPSCRKGVCLFWPFFSLHFSYCIFYIFLCAGLFTISSINAALFSPLKSFVFFLLKGDIKK